MMREYTGPAWITYLCQRNGIADVPGQYLAVKKADVVNGLSRLRPAPLNNAYGLTRGRASSAPASAVQVFDSGAVYTTTDRGICNLGEIYTTEAWSHEALIGRRTQNPPKSPPLS